MKTDIEIAQEATMKPITEIAAQLGLADEDVIPYGHYKAKIRPPPDPQCPQGEADPCHGYQPHPRR